LRRTEKNRETCWHGEVGSVRTAAGDGRDTAVDLAAFENPESEKRKELAKLTEFLVPGVSVVHIHACRTGGTEEFVRLLSKLWGGVTVRSFTDYQSQTGNEGEFFETGPTVTCTGDRCETKVLPSIWSPAPEAAAPEAGRFRRPGGSIGRFAGRPLPETAPRGQGISSETAPAHS